MSASPVAVDSTTISGHFICGGKILLAAMAPVRRFRIVTSVGLNRTVFTNTSEVSRAL